MPLIPRYDFDHLKPNYERIVPVSVSDHDYLKKSDQDLSLIIEEFKKVTPTYENLVNSLSKAETLSTSIQNRQWDMSFYKNNIENITKLSAGLLKIISNIKKMLPGSRITSFMIQCAQIEKSSNKIILLPVNVKKNLELVEKMLSHFSNEKSDKYYFLGCDSHEVLNLFNRLILLKNKLANQNFQIKTLREKNKKTINTKEHKYSKPTALSIEKTVLNTSSGPFKVVSLFFTLPEKAIMRGVCKSWSEKLGEERVHELIHLSKSKPNVFLNFSCFEKPPATLKNVGNTMRLTLYGKSASRKADDFLTDLCVNFTKSS